MNNPILHRCRISARLYMCTLVFYAMRIPVYLSQFSLLENNPLDQATLDSHNIIIKMKNSCEKPFFFHWTFLKCFIAFSCSPSPRKLAHTVAVVCSYLYLWGCCMSAAMHLFSILKVHSFFFVSSHPFGFV